VLLLFAAFFWSKKTQAGEFPQPKAGHQLQGLPRNSSSIAAWFLVFSSHSGLLSLLCQKPMILMMFKY
jgi:hypothetical protein